MGETTIYIRLGCNDVSRLALVHLLVDMLPYMDGWSCNPNIAGNLPKWDSDSSYTGVVYQFQLRDKTINWVCGAEHLSVVDPVYVKTTVELTEFLEWVTENRDALVDNSPTTLSNAIKKTSDYVMSFTQKDNTIWQKYNLGDYSKYWANLNINKINSSPFYDQYMGKWGTSITDSYS